MQFDSKAEIFPKSCYALAPRNELSMLSTMVDL